MTSNTVKFKRIGDHGLQIPQYETEGSAGMDIRANTGGERFELKAGHCATISTGFAVEIPPGYELQVRSRSGLAAKHLVQVLNSPGTIDSDYRGEIRIILMNHGCDSFYINHGDRIAQLVLNAYSRLPTEEVDDLTNTVRGDGGFGSTGRS